MQPDTRDVSYLWDMLQATREALDFTRGVTLEAFLQDRQVQLAVERAVEIVGEAASRIRHELREAHPEIPWRKVIAQRNVLAHEYGEVEPTLMWQLVTDHLPKLAAQIEPLLPPAPSDSEEP
jgi:uncharacterized protein with HEPN domain